MPDAYVTAHHLRDLLNASSVEQLITWSREPGLLPRVPSGPDRGKAFCDLPSDRLLTLAQDRDPDVRFSARTVLNRRGDQAEPRLAPPAQHTLL